MPAVTVRQCTGADCAPQHPSNSLGFLLNANWTMDKVSHPKNLTGGRFWAVVQCGSRTDLGVSPRVLRHMVSVRRAGFQKTQSLLPLVPVMVTMNCLPFIL